MLRQLLTDLGEAAVPGGSLRERAAASLACQAAIKKNWSLSPAEAQALLADLARVRDPHRCPMGGRSSSACRTTRSSVASAGVDESGRP